MFRIDDTSAVSSLPTPEDAGTEGYFTEGDPATGVPATQVRASWLNRIQEELRAIVVAAGLAPSKTSYTQVLAAITALMTPGQTLAGNGYRKFPGGLILQWGTVVTDASGNATTSFPIAFPLNLYGVVASASSSAGTVITNVYNSGGASIMTTLLVKTTAGGSPISSTVNYFALGQ
jgi:hypothetical protein